MSSDEVVKPILVFDLDSTIWDNIKETSEDQVLHKVKLYPGVRDLLKKYSEHYDMAVASFRADGGKILEQFGLKKYFKSVVCGHFDIKGSKFLHLLKISQEMGAHFDKLILFDDNTLVLSNGKVYGVTCVLVSDTSGVNENDVVGAIDKFETKLANFQELRNKK